MLSLTIDTLVNYIGFTIGILLGLGIILTANKRKASMTLGVFVVCFSIGITPDFIHDFQFKTPLLSHVLSAVNVNWFLFPLFYMYVQYVSILKEKGLVTPLIIGAIGFIVEFILFCFLSEHTNFSYFLLALYFFEIVFSFWVSWKILLWVKEQKKVVYTQYSNTNKKDLNWIRNFTFIGVLFTLFSFIAYFYLTDLTFFLTIINVVLLIWVALRGVFQESIKSLDVKLHKKNVVTDLDELEKLIEKASQYILTSSCYKITDFTIIDLAKELGVPSKKLSESINTILKSNFNSYINSYRIEEAKKLLSSDIYNNLSIEGIGKEVGFQSKSTFFRVFKKNVGMTPNEYKNTMC